MKIALYVHSFFPAHYHGTETYTLLLAKNLQLMGHEPIVVSAFYQGEKKADDLISYYEYNGIPVYCINKNRIPHSTFMGTYYQPEMLQVHRDLLEKLRPDIIHVTHLINHTAALPEAAHDLAIPTVATFTDFFGFCINYKLLAADGSPCTGPNDKRTNCLACCVKEGPVKVNSIIREQLFKKIVPLIRLGCNLFNLVHMLPVLRHSKLTVFLRDVKARPGLLAERYRFYNAMIAPTDFLKTAYEKNGFTNTSINKISFGVDLDRKAKQLIPSSTPIRFGFIGQIISHKGTDLLVEAFCRLPRGKSELHIYGSAKQSPAYTRAIKKRSINFPVFFRGTFQSEQMRSVLDELDFLVIPSKWHENSPLVLLNALASHTPVIVSDVDGLTEFLEPGRNGYIFARGSVDDLKRVMLQVIEIPDISRKLSLTTNYPKSGMEMTKEVLHIYNMLITKKAAGT